MQVTVRPWDGPGEPVATGAGGKPVVRNSARPTPGAICDGCGGFVAVPLPDSLPPMLKPILSGLNGAELDLPGTYLGPCCEGEPVAPCGP